MKHLPIFAVLLVINFLICLFSILLKYMHCYEHLVLKRKLYWSIWIVPILMSDRWVKTGVSLKTIYKLGTMPISPRTGYIFMVLRSFYATTPLFLGMQCTFYTFIVGFLISYFTTTTRATRYFQFCVFVQGPHSWSGGSYKFLWERGKTTLK